MTKTCSSCGASTTETLSATGSHSWSETGRTNPTCTADGVISYTCAGCGQSKTESNGSATGHSFSEGVCSACGAADPDYTPPTEAPTPAAEG